MADIDPVTVNELASEALAARKRKANELRAELLKVCSPKNVSTEWSGPSEGAVVTALEALLIAERGVWDAEVALRG